MTKGILSPAEWQSMNFFAFLCSTQQLYSVCKNMQTRVVELIPQLLDEGLIEELLVVNDDLNNAFIRYERYAAASLTYSTWLKEKYKYSSRILNWLSILGLTDLTRHKWQILKK